MDKGFRAARRQKKFFPERMSGKKQRMGGGYPSGATRRVAPDGWGYSFTPVLLAGFG